MPQIRARFAPSPTGNLHLGGVRTALYNWLFSRQNKGVFILRIEDTDRERSKPKFSEQIIKSLQYLGLDYDEGPYYQSQRLDLYNHRVQYLIQTEKAYEKEGAVYLKTNVTEPVSFHDLILGSLTVAPKELMDFVIRKSDGLPVYHFACVVDDIDMSISHVIRGMDHVSNTARQILIYRALHAALPHFAHIPLILGPDKERLSKRHGAESVNEYEEKGILPDALINFLARCGWGYKNQEIFSRTELIEKFNLKKVSKNPAIFDFKKMEWTNAQHLRNLPLHSLALLLEKKFNRSLSSYLDPLQLIQPRAQSLLETWSQLNCFWKDPEQFERKGVARYFSNKLVFQHLLTLADNLTELPDFTAASIEQALRQTALKCNISAGDLIHPTRLAVTGTTVGPSLFELLALMEKETVTRRLREMESRLMGKASHA